MPCSVELNDTSKIPILTGCPSDNEYFLVIGAANGAGQGGYGVRSWLALQQCLASAISFPEIDTIVGQGNPVILPTGCTSYTINAKVLPKSVKCFIDGQRIFTVVSDQLYIDIQYSTTFVTISFFNYSIDDETVNLGLQYGQKVIIDFAVSGSTPLGINLTTEDGFDITTEDGQNITI